MGTLIRVDGTMSTQNEIDLTSLQHAVGGYIQHLPLGNGKILVVDEEGKMKGKLINQAATEMAHPHVIVGDVVLCSSRELN